MSQPTPTQIADYVTLFLMLACLGTGIAAAAWNRIEEYRERALAARGSVMSRAAEVPAPEKPVASPVAEPPAEPDNRIATPCNADNEPLPVDEVIPTEAREIIRRQAQVELLARLVNAQLVPLAKGIEAGFECKRASRPDSTYKQVRDALEPLLIDPNAPRFRQPDGSVGPATRPVTSAPA